MDIQHRRCRIEKSKKKQINPNLKTEETFYYFFYIRPSNAIFDGHLQINGGATSTDIRKMHAERKAVKIYFLSTSHCTGR